MPPPNGTHVQAEGRMSLTTDESQVRLPSLEVNGPSRSDFKTEKEYQAALKKFLSERKRGVLLEAIHDEVLHAVMAERYEKINSLWKRCEEEIKRFLVPKEVVYEYRKYQDYRDAEAVNYDLYVREAIAWAKAKGAWRLCYGIYDETWDHGSGERGYDFTPILDASIEIRQECISHLLELRKLVIDTAKQTVPKLDDSIARLSEIYKQF